MEKNVKQLKLDNKELLESLQEIQKENNNIFKMLIRGQQNRETTQAIEDFCENNRKLIKVITILEYLETIKE